MSVARRYPLPPGMELMDLVQEGNLGLEHRGDQEGVGEERNQVRVRLLELFETLGNADDRVLKARRALMMALF